MLRKSVNTLLFLVHQRLKRFIGTAYCTDDVTLMVDEKPVQYG